MSVIRKTWGINNRSLLRYVDPARFILMFAMIFMTQPISAVGREDFNKWAKTGSNQKMYGDPIS